MKIPSNIITNNKIRDFDICKLYISGYSPFEIKNIRNLSITVRRIEQIIYTNKDFVNSHREWHKSRRINKLERQLRIKEENGEISKKDIVDILEQMRKEIEGDKPIIDQSQHKHFTVKIITDDNDTIRKRNRSTLAREASRGIE